MRRVKHINCEIRNEEASKRKVRDDFVLADEPKGWFPSLCMATSKAAGARRVMVLAKEVSASSILRGPGSGHPAPR